MTPFPAWLQQLIEIPDVTDVLVGSDSCQIDRGRGLEDIDAALPTGQDLLLELRRLALELGARLDIAQPIADTTWGKIRLHFVMPHGISDSAQLSVRIHPERALGLAELTASEMLSANQAQFLKSAFARQQTVVISGPTGSGKTTLLRALLAEGMGRVLVIEQTPELHLPWPAVSLRSRDANIDGAGEISLSDLVVAALRMRPDRIVIGEARRDEFGAFLQAVNNGHRGSATTIHATSLEAVPRRLITLGLLAGLSAELTGQLVLGAVDLVVQLDRTHRRQITGIGRPVATQSGFEIEQVKL